MQPLPLSYIELSASALRHNLVRLKSTLPTGTQMACVVKANAYGHGQDEIVRLLEGEADWFQVDDLDELRRLRQVSMRPVLLLGYLANHELEEAAELGASLAVYDAERLSELEEVTGRRGRRLGIQVMVDAYLGREGVLPADLPTFLDRLDGCSHLRLEGVYAHFANVEDTSDPSHAHKQEATYQAALALFAERGYAGFLTHISATAGALVHERPGQGHGLVRLGIGLYGLWPSEELSYRRHDLKLRPVLRWVSHLAEVKELPAGHSIGYGLTYVTSRPTRIALIPQGYSDGYDRGLSNCGEVLVRGSRCRVLGRVSMNMLVVDVTHLPEVGREEEAVLLGRQGEECISAEEVAQKLSTINYEVVARLSPLLPRVVVAGP